MKNGQRPKRGTVCTLLIPEEGTDNVIVPYGVYTYLNHHNMKDSQGQWMELWMLRQTHPVQHELSVFSALPGNVQTWPSVGHAVAHVNKFKVDRDDK